MLISRDLLIRLGATAANAERHCAALEAAMAAHGIDTELRVAHFLAQVMHESGCLRHVVENLNYSADGLLKTFPRHFAGRAEAEAYARKPPRIGSRVYGGRMGNGAEATGEGFRYRGRGLIQLTGKDNYRSFSRWLGEDVVAAPDQVAERLAAQSAVFFWDVHGLNALADTDDVRAVTRRINGGLNGFPDRLALLEKARRALREGAAAGAVAVAPALAPFSPTHRVLPAQLNLRRAPRVTPATLIAPLDQGSAVELRGPAAVAGWVTVRVPLAGVLREGVVAVKYLAPLPAAARARGAAALLQAAAAAALPPAHLAQNRRDISRTRDGGRAFPLGEAGRPARGGRSVAARAAALQAIVDYLDAAAPAHLRYQPRAGTTFCNIYAADYAYLCGAYLPRVWWTDHALQRLARGETVAPEYGQSVRELNANALHDWLVEHGPAFGWRREIDLSTLQAAANAGEVCLIVARRADLNRSGHITAVVPETEEAQARRDAAGEVLRPLESQAGARNFRRAVSASAWWLHPRFQAFAFWRHP